MDSNKAQLHNPRCGNNTVLISAGDKAGKGIPDCKMVRYCNNI